MPYFDYQCTHCGAKREVFIAPSREYPEKMMLWCKHERTQPMHEHVRIPSAPAVVIPQKHRAA